MAAIHESVDSEANVSDSGRIIKPYESQQRPNPAVGLQTLALRDSAEAFIYVPTRDAAKGPSPLLIYCHGAGGTGEDALVFARLAADHYNFIAVCPSSINNTWDILSHGNGNRDAAVIQQCLDFAAANYGIDWSHVCLSGFSDGASYALSLGLTNGDVFSHVIAMSPGFCAPAVRHGKPQIFICHGRGDKVLAIDKCSRKIVPILQSRGYSVNYREFSGGHTLRPDVVRNALKWFLTTPGKTANAG